MACGCGCNENKQLSGYSPDSQNFLSGLNGTGTGLLVFAGIAAVLAIAYVVLKATDKKKK